MNRFTSALISISISISMMFAPSAAFAKPGCEAGDLVLHLPFPLRQLNLPTDPTVGFSVERRRPSARCDYWIGFGKGQAATYDRKLFSGSQQIDYDVFKAPSSPPLSLKSYPEAASTGEVYTGRFDKEGARRQAFSAQPMIVGPKPGPFNVKRPGLYTDTVTIRVFEGTFPPDRAPLEIARSVQTYLYAVLPFSIVSLVDSGAPYTDPPITLKTLNFGTLTENKAMRFDMVLLYNFGYRVRLLSQHGSRMKHETAKSYVPYTLSINGTPIELQPGKPAKVLSGFGTSAPAPIGLRVPVTVKVGAVASSWAGPYADNITIEMTSL